MVCIHVCISFIRAFSSFFLPDSKGETGGEGTAAAADAMGMMSEKEGDGDRMEVGDMVKLMPDADLAMNPSPSAD